MTMPDYISKGHPGENTYCVKPNVPGMKTCRFLQKSCVSAMVQMLSLYFGWKKEVAEMA